MGCYAHRGWPSGLRRRLWKPLYVQSVPWIRTRSLRQEPPCDTYPQLPPWSNGRLRRTLVSRRQGCPYLWRGEGWNS